VVISQARERKLQFTVTVATPAAASTKIIPTFNRPVAPNVEEAVRKVTGEKGLVSQITEDVWKWQTRTHQGFAYAHPNA